MRPLSILIVSACLLIAGLATAEPLEGRSIFIDAPEGRAIPIKIGEGYEPGEHWAGIVSEEHQRIVGLYPITVAHGEAWTVARGGQQTLTIIRDMKDDRAPSVRLTKRDDVNAIDVFVQGELFTTYHYSNDERKPYLWPVKAPGDVSVTRDWPMGERESSGDHPHHVSFWTGYGDINGNDYWEYGDRTGWQRTESIEFGSGDACGWISTHIVWEDKGRKPVIDEHRTFRFYASAPDSGERLFDVDVRFTAGYGDVKFGDTKEGGMVSVRMADALRERGGTGTITTSEGITGVNEAWGKPAAWWDYSGTIEGVGTVGIAVMDSPTSFRHPTHWHVRDYGLMGANAFGYSHFYNGVKNGDHTLAEGESLSFSYRILVHAGDAVLADVAGHYADFANPPAVSIK